MSLTDWALTQELDMGMVEDCHPDHTFYQLFSEPADLGFNGSARRRTWVIGSHCERSVCLADPFELQAAITKGFERRNVHTQISDYLVASENEITMAATQESWARGVTYTRGDPLTNLLTEREYQTMTEMDEKYMRRFKKRPKEDQQLVYFLGDSSTYCSWSAVSGKIPTYRLNSAVWQVLATSTAALDDRQRTSDVIRLPCDA